MIGRALIDLLVEFDWPVVFYIVLLALVGYGPSVVWGLYVRNRWADGKSSNLGWRFRWSDLGWGPLTYLAALGCEFALFGLVDLLDIPLSSNVDDVSELGVDRAYLVATVITAVIAAPVVEELVFRGVVLRGFLSRFGPVAGDRDCRACCSVSPTSTRSGAWATSGWRSSCRVSESRSGRRRTSRGGSARRSSPTRSSTAS